jgi:flagellar hook assembly protein FlgD
VKVEESYSQNSVQQRLVTPANMVTTKIINRTTKPLKLKVGNNRAFRDIATIQKDGGVHEVSVDPNATYQEYCIAVVDAVAGKQFVVNSDECVDNKSITIVEADSKFDVVKEPRQSQA